MSTIAWQESNLVYITVFYSGVQVELDLIVLETQHDTDCDMFRSGSLECNCTSSFRYIII
jgi:hypothetical protein